MDKVNRIMEDFQHQIHMELELAKGETQGLQDSQLAVERAIRSMVEQEVISLVPCPLPIEEERSTR